MWVNSPEYLNWLNIVIFYWNFNIKVIREEGKAKVLEQVFFEIINLSRTEIIESFDLLQRLADIWAKITWNSYDG